MDAAGLPISHDNVEMLDTYEEVDLGTSVSYELHRTKRPSVTPAASASLSSFATASSVSSRPVTPNTPKGSSTSALGSYMLSNLKSSSFLSRLNANAASFSRSSSSSSAFPPRTRGSVSGQGTPSFLPPPPLSPPASPVLASPSQQSMRFSSSTLQPLPDESTSDPPSNHTDSSDSRRPSLGSNPKTLATSFTSALRYSPLSTDAELRQLAQQVMTLTQELKQDGDLLPWDFADLLMYADTLIHVTPAVTKTWAKDVSKVSLSFLQSAAAFECGSDERHRRIQDALDFHRLLLQCYEQSPQRAKRFLAKMQGGWYRKGTSMEQLLKATK
ncbi:hypothetical protein DFJ73DRAFT_490797 [Zopfochytrium polystomum]|nr:hypothetical protein DFJ73DRAFT_490797 [Zopfochytrium polystomum]